MRGRGYRVGKVLEAQAAIVGANIPVLRQRNGWRRVKLGELMSWRSDSAVCATSPGQGASSTTELGAIWPGIALRIA